MGMILPLHASAESAQIVVRRAVKSWERAPNSSSTQGLVSAQARIVLDWACAMRGADGGTLADGALSVT